jgi:hypothetical protein
MSHKFDDEFGPEIFKSISASKSIQLHSEIINKKTSNIPSSNGESSSSKNGKVDPSAEASAMESSVGISKASTSNLKTYTSSPSTNSNFTSLGNKKESLFEKTIPINVDEDNNSAKHLKGDRCEDSEDEDDSLLLSAVMKKNNDDAKKETPNVLNKSYEDSDDDDIPLSARLSQNIRPSKVQKGQKYGSNAINKQERTSTLSAKRLPDNNSAEHLKGDRCEDSEDEDDSILLSAMMKKNNDDGKKETPNVLKKSYDDSDDDDIPVSARLSQNIRPSKVQKRQKYGSNAIIKQERTSTLSAKRLPDKIDSLHSSRKKSKPSDQTSSINAKQISVKSEPNVEEKEAGIPLCQRTNKLATLVDKSSSLKKLRNVTKVNKGAAPSFKKKAKLKKSSNKSEHINSTKLQPSSDDGEKKWTTLVHNGVIFPPPYKPHGVKILYKGKLVTLTPDQEEVGFCL